VRLVIGGLVDDLRAASRSVDAIIHSFTVEAQPIPRTTRDHDHFANVQSGYTLRVPAEWQFVTLQSSPWLHVDEFREGTTGSMLVFTSTRNTRLIGEDPLDVAVRAAHVLDTTFPVASDWHTGATFAGHPARTAQWTEGGASLQAWAIAQGEIGYIVIATGESGSAIGQAARTFQLTE
jgi:hypothetical protein